MDENKIKRLLELYLDDEPFEDLLERLDIDIEELLMLAWGAGLLDEDTVNDLIGEREYDHWDNDWDDS